MQKIADKYSKLNDLEKEHVAGYLINMSELLKDLGYRNIVDLDDKLEEIGVLK